MAADLHYSDDYRPMIFQTTDFGRSWKLVTNGLPANDFVHSVHFDPQRKGLVYAGTEKGIFVSFDDGANWQSLELNLPPAPVYDTGVHGNDLIVATHGRAFWVLDNITALRQAQVSVASEPVHLYTPEIAYRVHRGGGLGQARVRGGENPPAGAMIDYYLSAAPAGPLTIEITDSHGQLVHRAVSGERTRGGEGRAGRGFGEERSLLTAHKGLNRFVWNCRLDPPTPVPGFVIMEASSGPTVPPGRYQVKLTLSGRDYTAPLEIAEDPRVKVESSDLEKQYDFAVELRNRVSEIHRVVEQVEAARAKLQAARASAGPEQTQAIDSLDREMAVIDEQLIQVQSTNRDAALVFPIRLDAQYADLMNAVESADAAPPEQTLQRFQEYEKKWQALSSQWKALEERISQTGLE
jgi:hypothetical protein